MSREDMVGTRADWETTSTILQELRDSSPSAWRRLDRNFRRPIVRFGVELGLGPEDAEDFAQEVLSTFARAYQHGRYDRTRGRLRDWLFGIARRKAPDALRRARSRKGKPLNESDVSGPQTRSPFDGQMLALWERFWTDALMNTCIRRVRREFEPKTLRAFELTVLQEKSVKAAAEALGMSPNAVSVAKYRVTRRVRELYLAREDEE